MTYTWFASTSVSFVAESTGRGVLRPMMSGSKLTRPWGRWVTSTKAMPGSPGMALKNSSKASIPPAEAPMPTMGNFLDIAGRRVRPRLLATDNYSYQRPSAKLVPFTEGRAGGTGCFGFGSTVMETFEELRHLVWAEEHLRQAHERITRQQAVVAAFEARGLIDEA